MQFDPPLWTLLAWSHTNAMPSSKYPLENLTHRRFKSSRSLERSKKIYFEEHYDFSSKYRKYTFMLRSAQQAYTKLCTQLQSEI